MSSPTTTASTAVAPTPMRINDDDDDDDEDEDEDMMIRNTPKKKTNHNGETTAAEMSSIETDGDGSGALGNNSNLITAEELMNLGREVESGSESEGTKRASAAVRMGRTGFTKEKHMANRVAKRKKTHGRGSNASTRLPNVEELEEKSVRRSKHKRRKLTASSFVDAAAAADEGDDRDDKDDSDDEDSDDRAAIDDDEDQENNGENFHSLVEQQEIKNAHEMILADERDMVLRTPNGLRLPIAQSLGMVQIQKGNNVLMTFEGVPLARHLLMTIKSVLAVENKRCMVVCPSPFHQAVHPMLTFQSLTGIPLNLGAEDVEKVRNEIALKPMIPKWIKRIDVLIIYGIFEISSVALSLYWELVTQWKKKGLQVVGLGSVFSSLPHRNLVYSCEVLQDMFTCPDRGYLNILNVDPETESRMAPSRGTPSPDDEIDSLPGPLEDSDVQRIETHLMDPIWLGKHESKWTRKFERVIAQLQTMNVSSTVNSQIGAVCVNKVGFPWTHSLDDVTRVVKGMNDDEDEDDDVETIVPNLNCHTGPIDGVPSPIIVTRTVTDADNINNEQLYLLNQTRVGDEVAEYTMTVEPVKVSTIKGARLVRFREYTQSVNFLKSQVNHTNMYPIVMLTVGTQVVSLVPLRLRRGKSIQPGDIGIVIGIDSVSKTKFPSVKWTLQDGDTIIQEVKTTSTILLDQVYGYVKIIQIPLIPAHALSHRTIRHMVVRNIHLDIVRLPGINLAEVFKSVRDLRNISMSNHFLIDEFQRNTDPHHLQELVDFSHRCNVGTRALFDQFRRQVEVKNQADEMARAAELAALDLAETEKRAKRDNKKRGKKNSRGSGEDKDEDDEEDFEG
jgi:hypothetical protein